MSNRTPSIPDPVHLRDALGASSTWDALRLRMQLSSQMRAWIEPVLAEGLRADIAAGPLDPEGWTLIAANTAVAAKLRHLLPTITARLAQGGYASVSIRVHLRKNRGG